MKKNQVTLIIVAVILIIAVFTNLNQAQHRDAVKEKLNDYLQKKAGNESALGLVIATAFVERTIETIVSSNNYLFFSLTKITWKGDSKIIGIGAFGNVFTFGKINEIANPNAE